MRQFLCAVMVAAFVMFGSVKLNAGTEDVNEILQSRIKQRADCIIAKDKQNILAADLVQVELLINLGNQYHDNYIAGALFLKTDESVTAFKNFYKMLESEDFVKALKPNFTLKTEEDGVALRSLFFIFDMQSMGKFFKSDDAWYFIIQEYSGEVEGYRVAVDDNGKITKISYSSDLKVTVPIDNMGKTENIQFEASEEGYISKADKKKMVDKLKDKTTYRFEIKPFTFSTFSLPINVYEANLLVETKDKYGVSTSNSPFFVIENKDKIELIQSKEMLINNTVFNQAVCKVSAIKNEKDAANFEMFLDEIAPAEDDSVKRFYKQEDVWFFVRENMFDQMKGYLVLVDDAGNIKAMDMGDVNYREIIRLRMQDPSYVVYWAFNKQKPTDSILTVTEEDEIPVEISFNADAVNAKGAWILAKADGKEVGMDAGTDLESPFTDNIPAEYLGKGKHTIEYILLPPGQNYDDVLSKVVLEIIVK